MAKSMEEMVLESTGYELAALKSAFELVSLTEDWKMPIKAVVEVCQQDVVAAAIEYYTGSKPVFTPMGSMGEYVKVEAKGYYLSQ